ncbi:hypothetical protein [Aeromicrobium sp.]|uniref:hypothetical protein n=1 Tax=Aeromicrobium sp. TaxID=1871063 RepID=UPI003D6B9CEB
MSSRRFGGFAGLGFVSTVLLANIILGSTGLPRAGASRSEVLAYFADHGTAIGVATALATLAWMTLPMYAAGVVAAVRDHERNFGDSWSLVALAGAVMQNAIFASVAGIQAVLGLTTISDDVAWGLWQMHNALFTLNCVSLVIVLVGVSIGGRRAGLLRGWQHKLGLTSAAAFAGAAVLTPVTIDGHPIGLLGFAGFALWLVWIASVSVALLREPARRDIAPIAAVEATV